jgi:adenylate cyclase
LRQLLAEWGLYFEDGAQEKAFFERYVLAWRRLHQAAIAMAVLLFYSFFIWDRIIDPNPDHHELAHAIRGLVVPPLGLAALLGLEPRRLARWSEAILVFVPLVGICALAAIYTLLDRGYEYGAVGFVLVSLWTFATLRMRLPYVVGYCLITCTVFNAGMVFGSELALGYVVVNNMAVITGLLLGVFAAVLRERDARREFLLSRDLEASRDRIEELLFSMLPDSIVRRIQSGEKTIADSYGEVSIVFADLVGFTALARRVAPNHLVEILNRLFTSFDTLAAHHGVEKIKTIGDAYMAVSGVGTAPDHHAERAADFALAIRESARSLAAELSFDIKLRIGIHIGPIVAGVIGNSRPAFDCWGESVNIASRMESSADSGVIQISEPTFWRLRQGYHIEQREDRELKGVGRTATYVLVGKLA